MILNQRVNIESEGGLSKIINFHMLYPIYIVFDSIISLLLILMEKLEIMISSASLLKE